MELQIEPEVLIQIHDSSEKGYPYEICGFMYGKKSNGSFLVTSLYVVINNDANKSVHYTIPPNEYMRAEKNAMELGLDIIGVYHSHPDHPPIPSGRDLDDALPELSYLITAVYQGQALDSRSWRLNAIREFIEEPLNILFKNKLSKSNTENG